MVPRRIAYELVLLDDGNYAVDVPTASGQTDERVRVTTGSIGDCTSWIIIREYRLLGRPEQSERTESSWNGHSSRA